MTARYTGRPDIYGIKLIACALGVTERQVWRYVAQGMPVHRGEERTNGIAICLDEADAWRKQRAIDLAAGKVFRSLPWAVVMWRQARRARPVAAEQMAMWAA